MTLEETLNEAMRVFLAGGVPEKMNAIKPLKYNKKYFDSADEELFPEELVKDDKKKIARI